MSMSQMWKRDEEGAEDEDDVEYDEEYEEEPQPTREEMEYLELRQRLKETFRKKLKKEAADLLGNSQEKKILPNDNFGCFFGPSRPAIAKRVIEERRSIMETQHLLASKHSAQYTQKKDHASASNGKPSDAHPKPVNELKTKVQQLKDSRDYSFLSSDDAELPSHSKEPAPQNITDRSTDAQAASMPSRKVLAKTHTTTQPPNGHIERSHISKSVDFDGKSGCMKSGIVNRPKLQPSVTGDSHGSRVGHLERSKSSGLKAVPSALKKNGHTALANSSQVAVREAPMSKPLSSAQKQNMDMRKDPVRIDRAKMSLKEPASSMNPKTKLPIKQSEVRSVQDKQMKKHLRRRPLDESDDDDPDKALSIIRNMFGYNPSRFHDDDDDSDMEANFRDIQKEERRSARIAREEDERELRLIEEEERQEHLRKVARTRKLKQHQ